MAIKGHRIEWRSAENGGGIMVRDAPSIFDISRQTISIGAFLSIWSWLWEPLSLRINYQTTRGVHLCLSLR